MTGMACTTEQHDSIKSEATTWQALRPLGFQLVRGTPTRPAYTLDMRNCPVCGSTLAMKLGH